MLTRFESCGMLLGAYAILLTAAEITTYITGTHPFVISKEKEYLEQIAKMTHNSNVKFSGECPQDMDTLAKNTKEYSFFQSRTKGSVVFPWRVAYKSATSGNSSFTEDSDLCIAVQKANKILNAGF